MRRIRYAATIASVFVALGTTGCFWLAVGGAGALGYEVGKDDRSVGTKVDDASITSSVKTRFIRDAEIDAIDINVDTYEGVVTLHGKVPTSGAEHRAVQLAKSVKGVRDVRSKLVVIPRASDSAAGDP